MDEIIAALEGLGWPVWDTDATGADLKKPYILLLSSDGRPAAETVLCGGGTADDLRVRHVATRPDAVRIMMRRTRTVLQGKRFLSGDSVIDSHFDGTTSIQFDPDVTIPEKGTHPFFADEEYTLFVQ